MAQQVWKYELDWKKQVLFKWFAYHVQLYWNTDLQSRGTNFWDTLYMRVGYVFDLRFLKWKIQPISMIFRILNK